MGQDTRGSDDTVLKHPPLHHLQEVKPVRGLLLHPAQREHPLSHRLPSFDSFAVGMLRDSDGAEYDLLLIRIGGEVVEEEIEERSEHGRFVAVANEQECSRVILCLIQQQVQNTNFKKPAQNKYDAKLTMA